MDNIIQATKKDEHDIEFDKTEYFIIKVSTEDRCIYAEYYNYKKLKLQTIKGKNAHEIYWTIIENKWMDSISRAAYLGKELTKAEYAILYDLEYVQN